MTRCHRLPILPIAFYSLLFASSPTRSMGQASSTLPRKEGVDLWTAFQSGGYLRTYDAQTGKHDGPWYLRLEGGLSDLLSVNYVDGYTLGPVLTWGHITSEGWRWELDENLSWAFSRQQLQAYGALRCILPVDCYSQFTLFGGRTTTAFDSDPVMPRQHSLLAAGLFGWDKQKYYQLTNVGLRAEVSLGYGFHVDLMAQWRKAQQLANHRSRNLLGFRSDGNTPRVNGRDYEGFDDDRALHPLVDLTLSWQPGQTLLVTDDLESRLESLFPRYTLRTIAALPDDNVSLELRVEQEYEGLTYMAATGWFPLHREVRLYDRHHFDASRFPWMRRYRVTWFSLLDEYELSTDRSWAEAHVEYCRAGLLLSRVFGDPAVKEYVQLHVATASVDAPTDADPTAHESRSHLEFSYGWALGSRIRVGASIGWDDHDFDGVAANLLFTL